MVLALVGVALWARFSAPAPEASPTVATATPTPADTPVPTTDSITVDGVPYTLSVDAWFDMMPQVGKSQLRSVMFRCQLVGGHPPPSRALSVVWERLDVTYGDRTWTGKPVDPAGLVHTQGLDYVEEQPLQVEATFLYEGQRYRVRLQKPVDVATVS